MEVGKGGGGVPFLSGGVRGMGKGQELCLNIIHTGDSGVNLKSMGQ